MHENCIFIDDIITPKMGYTNLFLEILALNFNFHPDHQNWSKNVICRIFLILMFSKEKLYCSSFMHVSETDQICSRVDRKVMIGPTQPRRQTESYEFLLILSYVTCL